jgi:hypothetical protein
MPIGLSKEFFDTAGWEDINKAYSANQGERNQQRLDILQAENTQLVAKGISDSSLQGDIKKQSEHMIDFGGIAKFAGLDVNIKPVDTNKITQVLSKDIPSDTNIQDILSTMSHKNLQSLRNKYSSNQEVNSYLAPYEHRAYARESVEVNPLLAPLFAELLIPGYQVAKILDLPIGATEDKPTSPDLKQLEQGYIGVGEGISKYISKEFADIFK